MGRRFEHKTRVLSEPFYLSFISGVDEDWGILISAAPIRVIDQISLLKCLVALGVVIEVVENLGEVVCFVKLVFGRKQELLRPNY